MAQQLSPQGYIYGEEPYSEHPFWEHEHVDANIEPITITPTNEQQVIEATALIDGYAPITVAAVPSENLQSLQVSPELGELYIEPEPPYTGFSDVTVDAAIPLTMTNGPLAQAYYSTSATAVNNAQAVCFNPTNYKNAAESVVGDYLITYFISVVVSPANYNNLETNIRGFWATAMNFQSLEGGSIIINVYTRATAQGSYVLHRIM